MDSLVPLSPLLAPRISLTIDGAFQLDLPRTLPALPGTASTDAHALDRLADLLHTAALRLVAGKMEAHAVRDAFPMLVLAVAAEVHLYIDSADEVDSDLNLVKGRASSLLREKMIDGAGGRFVFTVDESELVPRLGCTGAVHVDVAMAANAGADGEDVAYDTLKDPERRPQRSNDPGWKYGYWFIPGGRDIVIHTKKRNWLQHQRLNDNAFVSYNWKNMGRFQMRREKKSDPSYDPLVIEDFDWGNEWVDPTLPPPQGARGCPDDISWDLVDEAICASSSLQGHKFPRLTTMGRGTSSVNVQCTRQRKRPAPAPFVDEDGQEEDHGQHSSIPNEEDDDSDFVNDDVDVTDDDEDSTNVNQDDGDNTNSTMDEFYDGY
ncbi:hypothetical protein ACQ4PT_032613 [Festuca glaucescens]